MNISTPQVKELQAKSLELLRDLCIENSVSINTELKHDVFTFPPSWLRKPPKVYERCTLSLKGDASRYTDEKIGQIIAYSRVLDDDEIKAELRSEMTSLKRQYKAAITKRKQPGEWGTVYTFLLIYKIRVLEGLIAFINTDKEK